MMNVHKQRRPVLRVARPHGWPDQVRAWQTRGVARRTI